MVDQEDADSRVLAVKLPQGGHVELRGRPCELSAFSFVDPARARREAGREQYYQGRDSLQQAVEAATRPGSNYDRIRRQATEPGYDETLHRDDRLHAKSRGLHVHTEEEQRSVRLLSSGIYGQRVPPAGHAQLDPPDRKHVRVERTKEFSTRRGVNMKPPSGIKDY